MSARRGRGRRGAHAAHENDERWLLTYADMITLLMALFMVLFSISSVNISKFKSLQHALQDAFSGKVLSGGRSIVETGSSNRSVPQSPTLPVQAIAAISPVTPKVVLEKALTSEQRERAAALREQESFVALKHRLDAYAKAHGFAAQVQTVIQRRGLVVRLLTDKVLFASGSAQIEPRGTSLLRQIGLLLNVDHRHPIEVGGHTDTVPIHSPTYPSNWELSGARASSVVRYLAGRGVDPHRFTAAGYAYEHPIATNATAAGRRLNRRVEIVLTRIYPQPGGTR